MKFSNENRLTGSGNTHPVSTQISIIGVGEQLRAQTTTPNQTCLNPVDLLQRMPTINKAEIQQNIAARLTDDKLWQGIPKVKDANLQSMDIIDSWCHNYQ